MPAARTSKVGLVIAGDFNFYNVAVEEMREKSGWTQPGIVMRNRYAYPPANREMLLTAQGGFKLSRSNEKLWNQKNVLWKKTLR
jgi:hypothetical protein